MKIERKECLSFCHLWLRFFQTQYFQLIDVRNEKSEFPLKMMKSELPVKMIVQYQYYDSSTQKEFHFLAHQYISIFLYLLYVENIQKEGTFIIVQNNNHKKPCVCSRHCGCRQQVLQSMVNLILDLISDLRWVGEVAKQGWVKL